jgi:hypothetical protein
VLQVPEDKAVVIITPLGVPEKIPAPPKRKEIEEFVYHGEYGKR